VIKKTVDAAEKDLLHRILAEDIAGVAKQGEKIDEALAKKIAAKKKGSSVSVKPFITLEIEYLNAIVEDRKSIAHAGIDLDEHRNILNEAVEARMKGQPGMVDTVDLDYVDVSVKQCISIATALIPFLEHDDANRALMGSNMQRQAVSCVKPQSPVVGTGIEDKAAADPEETTPCGRR
jgi:DNA-directed RNA polymerase subunit beta